MKRDVEFTTGDGVVLRVFSVRRGSLALRMRLARRTGITALTQLGGKQ